MFDVYVLEKDTDPSTLPQEGTYYLITADGAYLHKDTDLFTATVKVDALPFLGTVLPKVTPKLEKIPPEILLKAWLFFRKVFRRRKAESELNLYYHKDRKEYLLVCRPQGVSFGSVNYGLTREELVRDTATRQELQAITAAGYRLIGTIHSHCSFEAFHSGTDERDESQKDGIHITVGHVDRDNFSLVASWAVNNNRFTLRPEDVILGIESISAPNRAEKMFTREQSRFFKIMMPIEDQERIEDDFQAILDEWLEMVDESWTRERQRQQCNWMGYQEPIKEPIKGEVVAGEPPTPFLVAKVTVPVLALAETRDLRAVRSHASALLKNNGQIPDVRLQELKATLCKFFKTDNLTQADIELAARVNPGRRVYDGEKADA